MMRNPLRLLCVVFMLYSIKSQAQQPVTLSLKQALITADQTYPGLAERQAIIGEYEFRKQEVQSRSIPQIQLQLQNSYGTFQGTNGAFFPVPGVFNVSGNGIASGDDVKSTGNTFGSVLMDWKFYEFGKQRNAIKAADYQLQGAKSGMDAARLALHAKVARLYVDIQYSQASLNWAEKNAGRLAQILALSVSLADAGLKPGADTAIASSAHAQALAIQHEWHGKYLASRASFTEVVPAQNISIAILTLKGNAGTGLSADSIAQSHPYLQVLDKQVLYEQAQQTVASRKIFPSLSLLGGLSARGSGINPNGTIENGLTSGYRNNANNYLVGVGMTWNIGTVYTSTLERKRAQKTVQGAQAKLDLQKLQMTTAMQALTARIQQQIQLLGKSEQAFEKASKAYSLYLVRYEGGLINLTELLQIQSLLQIAEKEYIQAAQTFWNLLTSQAELSGDFTYLVDQFN